MRSTVYIVAALTCLIGVIAFNKPVTPLKASSPTVYENAILILKDFVMVGGDKRLGFTSEEEFDNAWIDTSKGLRIHYLQHDTMTTTLTNLDSALIALDRVIYPVFTKVGGRTKLCSAITFDSTGGWQPIVFEDSTIIAPYISHYEELRAHDPNFTAQIVIMPQLENYAIVTHDKEGAHVLPTVSLRVSLGNDLPANAPADVLDETPIDDSLFIVALSHRLMRAYNELHGN